MKMATSVMQFWIQFTFISELGDLELSISLQVIALSLKNVYIHSGYSLVFCFVRGDGVACDFHKIYTSQKYNYFCTE